MRESTRAGTAGFRGSERMGDWLGRTTRRELLALGAGAFGVAASGRAGEPTSELQ